MTIMLKSPLAKNNCVTTQMLMKGRERKAKCREMKGKQWTRFSPCYLHCSHYWVEL